MKITKTVNITRYNHNRKLYSKKGEISDTGHYVALEDLAEEIKKGNTLFVSDEFGNDVTNKVLHSIVNKMQLSDNDLVKLIRG